MTELLPFTVQSTAALFTLLALLVPLIIHLLSKSRGTLVPFAHIALIKKIKSQPMQQILLVQRLLLFLRMVILVLAALLLAHLFYLASPEQAPRQVLLSPQWLTQATNSEKQRVATALPKTGATLLTAPLQTLRPAQLLTWLPAANEHNQGQIDNIWAKVKAHLSDIPADTEVEVYTSNGASQFVGEKPSFRHNIKWHIQALPPQPANTGQKDINIAVLYDSDRSEDLTYIEAALAALQKNIAIKLVVDAFPRSALGDDHNALANNTELSAADVIVYLSSEVLSAEILALISQGRALLMDAARPHSEGHWSATTGDALAFTLTGTRLGSPAPLGLADSASSSRLATAEILWQTDNQQTVLTKQGLAQGHIIALHSRFNPSWSNLVTQPAFPLQLARWLLARQSEQLMRQQARLSDEQIQSGPAQQTAMASRDHLPRDNVLRQPIYLTPLLAWLLLLFFAAERLLSEWQRSKPQRPNPQRSKPQRPKPGGDQ